MAHRVCPWWLGPFLANPLRRLWQNPADLLRPFVASGMTVLEPGCGMGFFTIDAARLVGPRGRVVAVDVQPRMLEGLRRRAVKAGLLDRIEMRLARPDKLDVDDLEGQVDFGLAFAMVHELPDARGFFAEMHHALKPGAALLVSEPRGHVSEDAFASMLAVSAEAGFAAGPGPAVRSSRTAVFRRT